MNGANQSRSITLLVMNVPPSPNVQKRKAFTPFVYGRLRAEWEREIFYLARRQDREWLQAMAALGKRMHVRILIQHAKLFDEDNAYGSVKMILDSLVRLRFLANDDQEHLELELDQERIRARQTSLTIREA